MKRVTEHLLILLCSLLPLLASCINEMEKFQGGQPSQGDSIRLTFGTVIPEPTMLNTRSVDPDGWGLQTLWLFCFDADGNYIGRSLATMGPEEGADFTLRGFTATVSSRTRIVHLLANQYLDEFNDGQNIGVHENTVMTGLISSSGKITYWGRVEAAGETSLEEVFEAYNKSNPIPMYRNQAKFTMETNGYLTISGFTFCNVYANGTSVPFNSQTMKFDWHQAFTAMPPRPYITTPAVRLKATDPKDVEAASVTEQYIFETPNTGEDEIYLIIKDDKNLYYKVSICDENKDPIPVYRNYHYTVNFLSTPTGGVRTFAEACAATPINNTWIAIDSSIPAIGNSTVGTLDVINTTVIYETGGEKTLEYKYSGNKDVSVSWLSNDGVSTSDVPMHEPDAKTITINVTQAKENEVLRGVLRVKAGPLVRYIKVYSVQTYKFTPVWCSTGIYNAKTEEDVGFAFNIPESYPEDLFPVRCLISTDILHSNGAVPLDVITSEEEGYGTPNGIGYKYLYEAKAPGMHRIYFHTSFDDNPWNGTGTIKLEAEHFETVEKTYSFTLNDNTQLAVANAEEYTTTDLGASHTNTKIYYMLVPRKKGSEVTIKLRERDGNQTGFNQIPHDVNVVIYTSHLEPTNSGDFTHDNSNYDSGPYWYYTTQKGDDDLTFRTLSANSEEMIRFATAKENMGGDYKSCALELANYKAWNFDFKIDNATSGIGYKAGSPVTLSFDIKAFEGSDSKMVDPGTGFYCYIKTSNLEPADDENRLESTDNGYRYLVQANDINNGRVTLNFKTNKIVSAETVTISTDPEEIDFNPGEASFDNAPLEGTIRYGNNAPLSAGSFVTLERKEGTRIGRVTINPDSHYSITLRGEYNFGWDETLYMKSNINGQNYECETTLEELSSVKEILLTESKS